MRIITYFADDVDKVAALLEKEFVIDVANSVDKRASLDPDKFGYLSLHHVVGLSPTRAGLTEYQRFPTLSAEVQTRSILQHAWAEIEHDLGYKTAPEVPRHLRRKFSRLAGLLELADEEFQAIRGELETYTRNVAETLQAAAADVSVDKVSLTVLLRSSGTVARLDRRIATRLKTKVTTEHTALMDMVLPRLLYLGLTDIAQVESALLANAQEIVQFAVSWLPPPPTTGVSQGISLFYLPYVLIAPSLDREKIEAFVVHGMEYPRDPSAIAERLLETWAQIIPRKLRRRKSSPKK